MIKKSFSYEHQVSALAEYQLLKLLQKTFLSPEFRKKPKTIAKLLAQARYDLYPSFGISEWDNYWQHKLGAKLGLQAYNNYFAANLPKASRFQAQKQTGVKLNLYS